MRNVFTFSYHNTSTFHKNISCEIANKSNSEFSSEKVFIPMCTKLVLVRKMFVEYYLLVTYNLVSYIMYVFTFQKLFPFLRQVRDSLVRLRIDVTFPPKMSVLKN